MRWLPTRSVVKQTIQKESIHCVLNILVIATLITLVAMASIMISENVHSGLTSYSDAEFDWNYSPPFPPMNPAYDNYTVLFDGHTHTVYSDGSLTPKQVLEWHIANGYNAVAVTDHNTLAGALAAREIARKEYDDKIKVLIGMEYSCCRIHMNLIGIETPIVPSGAFPSDEELQAAINQTHAQGGFVTVNHIPWSVVGNTLPDHPTVQQLYEWGVDYIEVVWQNLFDYQDYVFALDHGMGVITGCDMHTPGRGTNGWTTIVSNFTEEGIFDQLKKRKTSIIYNAVDSPYGAGPIYTPKNIMLGPFFKFANVLNGFYWDYSGMYSFTGSFCQKHIFEMYWKDIWIFIFWLFMFYFFGWLLKKLILVLGSKLISAIQSCRKKKNKHDDDMLMVPFLEADTTVPLTTRRKNLL